MEGQETTVNTSFFTPIANTKPFFKAALQGFAGSGKTYTAGLLAIGLHKRIESKKPIVIFDTETASKFLKEMLATAGIEALVKESRSLADLKETMKLMREGAGDILLIDSISHLWENFLESYKAKVHRTALQFQDWGIIKPTWKTEFSDPFVRDKYHIIMTGRAGYEYENEVNQDTGKREIYKSGVKMKVEGETAYEPDLLVNMERMQEMEAGSIKRSYRQAIVIKDRSTAIDGKVFENPTYADFAPAIEIMLDSPAIAERPAERDSALLFKTEEEKLAFRKERDIILEEIEGYMIQVRPGMDAQSKKFKMDAIQYAFGSTSWTAISMMMPSKLNEGFGRLQEFVRNETAKIAEADKEPIIQIEEVDKAANKTPKNKKA